MKHQDLRSLDEEALLRRFSDLVEKDRSTTATMLRYIAEIDRRKLYLKQACPSMFAFCVERFHMSEAIAHKRIRGGRAASRFPRIFGMVERGELHLTAVHQLSSHLTEDNQKQVLARAKHKTMRQIEQLIAEIAPKPDVPPRIARLPLKRTTDGVTPLSPRRYRMQVTMSQEARDKFIELQELMSHQIPDGDPAEIVDRALDVLLDKMRKQKAALTDKPGRSSKRGAKRTRSIPAAVKREAFRRDEGRCRFVDDAGNRCTAKRFIEYHHRDPFARGGGDEAGNIELRCHAHNQYEADLDYGALFMTAMRSEGRRPDP